MKRVVVTGMSGLSPVGQDWASVRAALACGTTGVRVMSEWADYEGLLTRLGGPVDDFERPAHYGRKSTRSMGRVALMATRATELALDDAGLLDDPVLTNGRTGVAYGSSTGSTDATAEFAGMLLHGTTAGLNATTYIRMMAHTTPVNLAVFFGLQGRVYTTSSACTSGSQGIGCAFEAIRSGAQTVMVAGGAEELCPTEAAVFDALYATSTCNDAPATTPRPFDAGRDGLVIGEGAGTLILEELEHAQARGAPIYAEVAGYATNADGRHVTQPETETMRVCMELALDSAALEPEAVGYVSAHGTATDRGDAAENRATREAFGRAVATSALKSFTGHTLGACGVLEAWVAIESMRAGWFHRTVNLDHVDPECADLDHIVDLEGRGLDCEYVMSNNFAFGGINTSLLFRRWP
jgi:3-oxoacyl-[acyl-carrier-protein] synthase II